MYRRILVPIDGSPTSIEGLKHAIGLAKDQRAQLHLLHVVDDMVVTPLLMDNSGVADLSAILDSLRDEGREALSKAAALAEKSGVKAKSIQIKSGPRPVSNAILATARRNGVDVIVMGTHGRRGLNRLLLGSDAERVLREASVPVLLVRQGVASKRAPARRGLRGRARSH